MEATKESAAHRYSITDLRREFGVTARTLRHYESVGLLSPERSGQQRHFSERDRVRLRLALRGRALGFNLAEIAEMIDLYDLDPTEMAQLERTLAYGRGKLRQLEAKRAQLTEAIEELAAWERRLSALLSARRQDIGSGTDAGSEGLDECMNEGRRSDGRA